MNMREMLEFVADWLEDCLSCDDAEMMGISEVLEDVRNTLNTQPAAPEPDWSTAPEWARVHVYLWNGDGFYASDMVSVDLNRLSFTGWTFPIDCAAEKSGLTLPLGVDWRTTLRHRPEVS